MPRPPASPLPEEEKVRAVETSQTGGGASDELTDSRGKTHSSSKHAKKTKKHSKPDASTSQPGDSEVVVGSKPKRHKKSTGEKPVPTNAANSYSSPPPPPTTDSSDLASGSKRSEIRVSVEEEPVKKKKKRSKDHQSKVDKVKRKKSSVATAPEVPSVLPSEPYPVDTTSKASESHHSKDRNKGVRESDKPASRSTAVRKHQLPADSPPGHDHERSHRHLAPVSHDATFHSASPAGPGQERYASSRHSSRSSRFSSSAHSRSSSYSRSPSHRPPDRRADVKSYRERDRGPRSRAPERSRSPDPRHFCPRRTYVAYHRHASHSRDSSSLEDYGHDSHQTRFRRSRSRSHGSSRPAPPPSHYEVAGHDYDPPQSTGRPRMPSPRRTYSQRHYREDHDRGRESPRRPPKRERYIEERHPKHEIPSSDERRNARPYRSHERPHDTTFTSPESTAPISMHEAPRRGNSSDRSRHRESRRSAEGDRRVVRKDRPRASPIKASKRQPMRSEHQHSRDEKDHEKQRPAVTSKSERSRRRASPSEDRQSTGRATPSDSTATTATTTTNNNAAAPAPSTSNSCETSHQKPAKGSKSPRRTKSDSTQPRKSQSSSSSSTASKLRPVLDHLDQLQFENVSDTELESMLTPATFLTNAQLTESRMTEQHQQQEPHEELRPAESGEACSTAATATSNNTAVDASKPDESTGEQQSDALVLDTLDKISSQLRQKSARPETWDSAANAPGSQSDEDELDEDEDAIGLGLDRAMHDPSVIGMATTKIGVLGTARARQLTAAASLTTPWQQLIESAGKAQGPSREQRSDETVQPAVCIGNPLNSDAAGTFPYRLVALPQRASGARTLMQVGVSARYLGPELFDCLNKELARLAREQTEADVADVADVGARDPITARPIAWMHRTQDALTCGQDLPKHWFDSCLTFGVLGSRHSDTWMRQYLLQSGSG